MPPFWCLPCTTLRSGAATSREGAEQLAEALRVAGVVLVHRHTVFLRPEEAAVTVLQVLGILPKPQRISTRNSQDWKVGIDPAGAALLMPFYRSTDHPCRHTGSRSAAASKPCRLQVGEAWTTAST